MNLEKEAVSMGIIRAAAHAVGGGLADQWLEVIEPENMGEQTVFSAGVQTRRGENRKRTPETGVQWFCDPCVPESVYDAGGRR
mgnify:CR=1 FL=1